MGETGHLQRLLPLVAGLTDAGIRTHVFTSARFRDAVEQVGGRFVDLFADRSLQSADATSLPVPVRFVSFAGRYAEQLALEAAALEPGVVLHDGFAVIGMAVANRLGVPRVAVCAGHNRPAARALADLGADPRVKPSDAARRACAILRERFGIPDASPLSYAATLSRDLNVYCEPPEFLRPEERPPFEPIAFFGSVTPDRPVDPAPMFASAGEQRLRVYASLGTVVWRYWKREAAAALEAIADAVSSMRDTEALLSLGGGDPARFPTLARARVRVASFLDQWSVIPQASVFITHHGMNSTHEAIFHRVPMGSLPFQGDQPGMAKRCEEAGFAVPVSGGVVPSSGSVVPLTGGAVPLSSGAATSPPTADDVRRTLAILADRRPAMQARLEIGRQWELAVIRNRPAVIERIRRLMR